MRKIYMLFIVLLPFLSFSQQQLLIKGIHPNFYVTHIVSQNETYASIAKLYNISSSQIASYNDLTLHNGKIFARTLQIPLTAQNFMQRASTLRSEVPVPVDYRLNPNETLTHVLARFKLSVQMLKLMNNLSDQQLNSANQFTVGFLLVKPDVASFFGTRNKQSEISKAPGVKPANETGKTDAALNIKKETNGIRTAKSRTDEKLTENNPPANIIDSTAVRPNISTADNMSQRTATPNLNRLKVFVDCSNTWCDRTFIRTEINIVDFLLDRVASDVHLLITSQRNGNGGTQYQMIFYGQNKFRNVRDTIRVNIDPNATDSERRDEMVQYIKRGLTPFILKTDYAKDININMKKSQDGDAAASNANTKDKWNYWVFRAGANGNVNLQEVYKSNRFNGNFSANRTTDKLKTGFSVNAGQTIERYFDDSTGEKIETIKNSNYNFEHFLVKSLSARWSAAYQASTSNSTFSNNKSRMNFGLGIEYAIFPYKEVNNKFFTINTTINVRKNKYYDTTIYFKTEETLLQHEVSANLSLKQKWGTINSQAEYSTYLHNTKLNSISLFLNFDVRITGGLSVFSYMSGARVNNQIHLIKGRATALQVLTRQRELASKFRFNSGFGISYRFGSKLNNFVNPRFDDAD
jgi:LysM repeat protein